MVPIASGYAPINDLNASIMAQDARGMADRLARQEMNNRMIAEAINAQVRQKQIASESGDRQQHYSLQRQQLSNDMAYRNQALGQNATQFDKQFGLNEAIARHQMANPRLDPSAIPAVLQREEFNTEATGIAGSVNMALKTAKAKRDAMIKEIEESQKTNNFLTGDFWRDVWNTDADWAKKVRALDGMYRDEVSKISQAAQGKATIRQTTQDDYEAVPVTLPQINFPGLRPSPVQTAPIPQPVSQPQPTTGVNPFNFFGLTNIGLGGGTPVTQSAPVRRGSYSTFNSPQQAPQATPMAPMVQPAQLPRRFIYNMNGTLSPAP